MTTTPRTNAVREAVNASGASYTEDICTCLDAIAELERENQQLRSQLEPQPREHWALAKERARFALSKFA